MPQKFLVDIDTIDLNEITADIDRIRVLVPHRYQMEQLSGILKFDPENKIIIGYKDVKENEFWVRGHIPGNPLARCVNGRSCRAIVYLLFQEFH